MDRCDRGVKRGTKKKNGRFRTMLRTHSKHRAVFKYHHLIIALAVRDSMGVLLVKVKSMLYQELD